MILSIVGYPTIQVLDPADSTKALFKVGGPNSGLNSAFDLYLVSWSLGCPMTTIVYYISLLPFPPSKALSLSAYIYCVSNMHVGSLAPDLYYRDLLGFGRPIRCDDSPRVNEGLRATVE